MGGLRLSGNCRRCPGTAFFCALLLCTALVSPPSRAELAIDITIEDIEDDAFSASGIRLTLKQATDGRASLTGHIERLSLPGLDIAFTRLSLDCPEAEIQGGRYVCREATLDAAEGPAGPQQLTLNLRYAGPGDWDIDFSGLRLAGGVVTGGFSGGEAGWQGRLQATGLQARQLVGLSPGWSLPAGWTIGGRVRGELVLTGVGTEPGDIDLSLRGRDIAYADAEGLQAAEGLDLRATLTARAVAGDWRGRFAASLHQGQVYSDPVFVDVGNKAITLTAGFQTRAEFSDLELSHARLSWPEMLEARLAGRLGLTSTVRRRLDIALDAPRLMRLYPVLLQPLLTGTALGDASIAGGLQARLSLAGDGLAGLEIDLDDLHLDDNQGRFGIAGLGASLHWRRQGTAMPSRLAMESGHLYAVDIGAAEVGFIAQGDQLRLTGPLVIPLLGGEARLQAFALSGLLGEKGMAWQASADLAALSLPILSQKLGWPIIGGELNGHVPSLSYQQGVMRLGGELTAQALGGEVSIVGLTLHDPLGPVPVMEADARLQGLDLEQLTRTFSFGRITGLLDGEVNDLQLVGWQPSRFEARFYSPEDAKGPRRRISQRAVENLTELGNGVAVGLSGTFLRFFEDFAYDRILLAVKLQGQNAELDGMPHRGGGYYLVRGRGLPRIDVVGRNRRVAWRDLVGRLKNIRFEGVQVQH